MSTFSLFHQRFDTLLVDSSQVEPLRIHRELEQKNAELLRLQNHLTKRIQEIELLYQIERETSAAQDLPELLESLSRRAVQLLSGEAGMIGLARAGGAVDLTFFHQPPIPFGQTTLPPVDIKHTRLPPGTGLIPWVVSQNAPLLSNDVAHDSRTSGRGTKVLELPIRQAVIVPLHYIDTDEDREVHDQVLGAMAVLNKTGEDALQGFDRTDQELLTLIAGHAARAIVLSQARALRIREGHLSSLGSMMAGLIHDLRTPLTVISGYAELLSSSDDSKERTLFRSHIQKQCTLVESMIQEVLSFAKGETHLLVRRLFLNHFLAELQEPLTRELAPVLLEIKAHYQGPAWFDEHKMMRIFQNLARNAAQAMPQGGIFRIEVDLLPNPMHQNQRDLVLTFSDNGPGIPEEIQPHLFEPFSSQKSGGTGLGLPMMKKIVEDHGGTIRIRTQKDAGTTFLVSLPQPLLAIK